MKDLKIAVGKLREEINAHANQSRELADQRRQLKIQGPETGPQRDMLWHERKSLGRSSRALMLASGLLRGRAYRRMEPKVVNPPSPYDIASWLRWSFGITGEKIWLDEFKPFVRYVEAWLAEKPEGVELPEAAE